MKTKIILLAIVFFTAIFTNAQNNKAEFEDALNILVFSKTSGFRHASISSGVKML